MQIRWRRQLVHAAGTTAAILATAFLIQPVRMALPQQAPMTGNDMPAQGASNAMQGGQSMIPMHGQDTTQMGVNIPTMPGQDAFGAIQEVVRMLEADPTTDWSKVDLEALRQHLIDMNEVTLNADAVLKPVDGGLEIAITGEGRTFAAIRRMVPPQGKELNRMNGWSARSETLPNGVLLTVTANDATEVKHIRGLGFIGLLVSGAHHQPHHLAIAKGEMTH
jgi:hypothetical protein